jgi:uncharacterized protein YecT (DUF1311 family)
MMYSRLSLQPQETWVEPRYAPPPPRRQSGSRLLPLLSAILLMLWGFYLMFLGYAPPGAGAAPRLAVEPSAVLQEIQPQAVQPQAVQPTRGIRIVVAEPAPIPVSPDTWAALPTALTVPLAATPLADPVDAPQKAAACREAPSLAAQMVCVDPTLGVADQRAAAAYDAALEAGVSPALLGRSQAHWLLSRDAAARSSPEDLLAAYQAREHQLLAAAALAQRTVVSAAPPADPAQPRALTGAAPST